MNRLQELFLGMQVCVKTESGTVTALKPQGDCWDGPGIHAKVTVKDCGKATAVMVDAVLTEETFYPEDGLRIYLKLPDNAGIMADYQHSEYWCRPAFLENPCEVPDRTQGLLWEKGGTFGYLLPVCGEQYKAVLCGDEKGVFLRIESWFPGTKECHELVLMTAAGNNPRVLAENCTEIGLSLLPGSFPDRKGRRYPERFEYLGWCSWDALQIRVGEAGLVEKCAEFREKGIPVRWIIIDDMWGDVKGLYDIEHPSYKEVLDSRHSTTLNSFEGDPYRFPEGLKHCVEKIRKEFGVEVGIWHPTSGYWSGIDPEGNLMKEYGQDLILGANGKLVPDFRFEHAFDFYNGYHQFLRECGVDFLKIDNQSTLRRFYHGFAPIGEIAAQAHQAIEASVGLHFDGKLINCMGMANENMWHRPISAISRASDDFLPENRSWFTKHILQCSYNSLVQGSFLWCDWDMWWTDDTQGVKNSVLRAISGGPIYVSDPIGRSRKEILEPLTLADGRILRCDNPAIPSFDCLTKDPEYSGKPFKVFSSCGNGAAAAAFNLDIDGKPVRGFLKLEELGLDPRKTYAVYERFSGEKTFLTGTETLPIILENPDDFRLYLLVPEEDGFAAFGLMEKFIAPKTISSITGQTVLLKERGTFLFASRQPVKEVLVNGEQVSFQKDGEFYEVEILVPNEAMLTVKF